jgi:2-dehydro-3-deoxygluconokinase
MTADILGIGEPLYELNQQPDGRFLAGFGGDTLNAVIAAARLGARSNYFTRLGGDFFGDAIMDLLRREEIGISAVARDPLAPTGLYFVTHDDHGHSFTYRRQGSAASLVTPRELPTEQVTAARYLHVSGISLAISKSAAETVTAAISVAKNAGTAISFDTNFRPKLWTARDAWPVVRKVAESARLLKTSTEDCVALIGLTDPEAIARHFLDLGSHTVLVTLGARGVLLATQDSFEHIAGYDVEAIDATGAGDAFTGAMLAELCRGTQLPAAVGFANAAAALSTLGYGAISPLPRRTEVEEFMERYK